MTAQALFTNMHRTLHIANQITAAFAKSVAQEAFSMFVGNNYYGIINHDKLLQCMKCFFYQMVYNFQVYSRLVYVRG